MMVHGGGRDDAARLLRRRPGPRRDRARRRAGRRSRSTSTPRRRRRSTSARPPAGCRAPPPGSSQALRALRLDAARPSWSGPASASPARARRSTPSRPTSSTSSRRSTTAAGDARALRAGGRPLREGDVFRFPELAEALERFGAEGAEPFYRGEVAAAITRLRRRARRHARRRRPRRLRGDRARADPRRFRGTEVLTNPPPSSGGILIAYCARPARAARRGRGEQWSRRWRRRRTPARGFTPAVEDGFAERFLYDGRGAARRGFLDPAGARPRRRRPARLDHPHLGPRRRRAVRQRHLLQRLGLGRAGARDRRDPQQHARRGGPQPARLPLTPRAGGCPR